MADELIDIYNENNEPTGIKEMKSIAHRDGLWHRTAHVWIYNSEGEILLQLRAKNKELYPDMWDISAAGHIGAGESEIVSAIREISEEIGIDASESDLNFFKTRKHATTYKKIINNEFCYIYFFKYDKPIASLKLQKEEVGDLKFFNSKIIEGGLETATPDFALVGNFTGDYWPEIIDQVKKLSGK